MTTTLPTVVKPSMDVNISFRVRRALRDAAQRKATEQQENVSDVLRAALDDYVAGDEHAGRVALELLARLSEQSTDGKLRDAIATVRSALWDEVDR